MATRVRQVGGLALELAVHIAFEVAVEGVAGEGEVEPFSVVIVVAVEGEGPQGVFGAGGAGAVVKIKVTGRDPPEGVFAIIIAFG